MSLEAMRLPPGSEVITGDFNMIAVPRAIAMAGLTPVFVDCDDWLLMPQELINGVPHNDVSAVIAVHVYGRRQDMDRLWRYAAPKNWQVVEDLAEAHGVRPHEGTNAACWSFYKNKIVAGEEGGAVWFRNPEHAELARSLRTLGFTAAHDYTHVPRGMNYRLANRLAEYIIGHMGGLLGAWNVNSLSEYTENVKVRREIESWYDAACPSEWRMPARDAGWVYDLRIREMSQETQNAVVAALKAAGVAARHGFKPMHRQEEFQECRLVMNGGTSNASFAADEVIYLPVQPGRTTRESCRHCFDVIKATLSG